jgi:hypothetical protein
MMMVADDRDARCITLWFSKDGGVMDDDYGFIDFTV